jgi:hypothetical protein
MCKIPVLRDETALYFIGIGLRAAKHIRFGLACHMTVPSSPLESAPWPSIDKVWRAGTVIDGPVRNAAIRGWFNQHVFPVLLKGVECLENTAEDQTAAFCWWVTKPSFIKVNGWNFMEWAVVAGEMK